MRKKKVSLEFTIGFLFGFLSPEVAKQLMSPEQYEELKALGDQAKEALLKILKERKEAKP